MKNEIKPRLIILITLMLSAAFSRLLPHPPNFSPIGALGLFGAAYFSRKLVAVLLPLISLWVSSLVLNNTLYAKDNNTFIFFYDGAYWVFGAIALTTIIGFYTLKKVTIKTVLVSSVLASVLFFLITNFGYFLNNPLYSQNFNGLFQCYIVALPFFGGTFLGNIFYSAVLFGGFELIKYKFPVLVTA